MHQKANSILEAARAFGFRLIAGRMLADRTPDWPESLRVSLREQLADAQAMARDIASKNPEGLLRYAVSVTNPLFCSDECLTQAKALADAGGHPLKIVLTTDKSQIEPALMRDGRHYMGEPLHFRLLTPMEAIEARAAAGLPAFEVTPSENISLAKALRKPRKKIYLKEGEIVVRERSKLN